MGVLADEYVRVRADTSYMGRDLKKQGAASGKTFGGAFGASLKGILGAAVVFKALSSATSFLKEANAEARESQKVNATTTQIIKSTGGAAKVTSGQVSALATAISNKTGKDDEAVQAGANLLLTFKRVRNETGKGAAIFDRATAAAVDLSAAGFGSVDSASKMLGKALNDPIRGLTSLGRAGVTFTDQQKQQIKAMVESGDVLGAQKLIMKEVESQVGGVAAASATAGEKMKVAWDNSKEALGTALLPVVDEFAKLMITHVIPAVSKFAGWLGERIPGAIAAVKAAFDTAKTFVAGFFASFRDNEAGATVTALRTNLQAFADFIRTNVMPAVRAFAQFFVAQIIPALKTVAQFILAEVVPGFLAIQRTVLDLYRVVVPIIGKIVGAIVGKFIEMKPQIMSIWTSVKEIITGVMFIIKDVIQAVTTIIKMIWDRWGDQITAVVKTVFGGLVTIISGVMKTIAGIIKLVVALIKGDWQGAWNAIKQIFAGVWQAIKGILTVATAVLWQVLQAWWTKVKALWTSATTAVKTTWSTFWTNVKTTASTALEWVRSKVVTVLDKIKNAFSTAKTNIKKIWDGVKTVVSTPVTWIKDNVYNKPLVPVWNRVADLVGGPKLEDISLRAARFGGRGMAGTMCSASPRSGRATAMVEPGEWIAPRWMSSLFPQLESIRKRGRSALRDVGDPKSLPGFAGGGLVGWCQGSRLQCQQQSWQPERLGAGRFAGRWPPKSSTRSKALIGKAMPNNGLGTTVGSIGKKAHPPDS